MFESSQSTEVRDDIATRPATVRSRVTNGKMIAGVDGRSAKARRYRDLCQSFADDCGGAASLNEAQRALVRQAATLTIQGELLQGAMIRGEPVDVEQQTRVANSLSRSLSRLGIRKRADRKLSVPEYLAQRDARRAQGC
jgi:translation initiation factor 1 (eIF-1/SUI1)